MPPHWTAAVLIAAHVVLQPANRDLRDVLAAVLSAVELRDDDVVQAGRQLDSNARAALVILTAAGRAQARGTSDVVPANTVVVESVVMFDRRAVVRLTYGPVPATLGLVCGETIVLPLRRGAKWRVVDEDVRTTCANRGPGGLARDDERLLEAARLAFSSIGLSPADRVLAGSGVSAHARTVLSRLVELPAPTQFETKDLILPAEYFTLHTLDMKGDVVTFEGALGEVPRNGSLGCGANWHIRLRHKTDGWVFDDKGVTVC
jgi:hypothetical protein